MKPIILNGLSIIVYIILFIAYYLCSLYNTNIFIDLSINIRDLCLVLIYFSNRLVFPNLDFFDVLSAKESFLHVAIPFSGLIPYLYMHDTACTGSTRSALQH